MSDLHQGPSPFDRLEAALATQLDPKPEHMRLNKIRCFLRGCELRSGSHFESAVSHVPIGKAYARGERFLDAMELFQSLSAEERAVLEVRYEELMSKIEVGFPELKAEFPRQFS